MAKTALDLTGDEWLAYDPGAAVRRRQASVDPQVQERWQQAQQLAREAAQRLRDQFAPDASFCLGLPWIAHCSRMVRC